MRHDPPTLDRKLWQGCRSTRALKSFQLPATPDKLGYAVRQGKATALHMFTAL